MLYRYQVPVAYSMVEFIRRAAAQMAEPFQEFMFYWMGFNNIYTTLSDQDGRRRAIRVARDGTPKRRAKGNVTMPAVEVPSEQEQLTIAFGHFSADLKHSLITHDCTRFFVHRSPLLHGTPIEVDAAGQRVNGVLNVGYTIDADNLVWSPIDTELYERYIQGDRNADARDALAKQILDLLYTVRCNTFHGGKRMDDSNDREVVERATPLLALIVTHFLADAPE